MVIARCVLLVACWLSLFNVRFFLIDVRRSLRVARCLFICCVLFVTVGWLFVVCYSFFVARCCLFVLFVVCCLMAVGCCALFVVFVVLPFVLLLVLFSCVLFVVYRLVVCSLSVIIFRLLFASWCVLFVLLVWSLMRFACYFCFGVC